MHVLSGCLDMKYGDWYPGSLDTVTNINSTDGCRRQCLTNPECKYWSWDSVGDMCYLYNDIEEDNLELRESHYFGEKICLSMRSFKLFLINLINVAEECVKTEYQQPFAVNEESCICNDIR